MEEKDINLSNAALEYMHKTWPVNSLDEGPKQVEDIFKYLLKIKDPNDPKLADPAIMARAFILIARNLFENIIYDNLSKNAKKPKDFKETIEEILGERNNADDDLLTKIWEDCQRYSILNNPVINERIKPSLIILNLLSIKLDKVLSLWNEINKA